MTILSVVRRNAAAGSRALGSPRSASANKTIQQEAVMAKGKDKGKKEKKKPPKAKK